MAGLEEMIKRVEVNPYMPMQKQAESIWTPKQALQIGKTQDIRKVTLPTIEITKPLGEPTGFSGRKIAEMDLDPKSQAKSADISTDHSETQIEGPKTVAKGGNFTADMITDEAVDDAVKEVARTIIKNDDRIDQIFTEMQRLQDSIQKEMNPVHKELFQRHFNALLDELIVRSTLNYCQLTHEDIYRIRELIKQDVHQLQDCLKDKGTLVACIVSGVIGIGGAALGFSQGGLLGFSASQVKAASATAAAASQSGTMLAQYSQQTSQGRAEVIRALFKERDTGVERDRTEAMQKARSLINQIIEMLRTRYRDEHHSFETQAS